MEELWKEVKGFIGLYQVSNTGNIKSMRRNKLMKQSMRKGYKRIGLHGENFKIMTYSVHRLVAMEFVQNPNNNPVINHKDGNKLNNNANNLEWVTQKENITHSYENELRKLKEISQYDKSGKLVKKYKNITKASKETNIDESSIAKVCRGERKTAGKYKWQYA